MMKIKWNERISNEEILIRVEEKINMNALRRRKGKFIGHISRQGSLLKWSR
jgi:hypothetical protein